jgi:ferrochelatase
MPEETSTSKKQAVLLLQMGGPQTVDEVESFLYNLFSDKYIIQLPSLMQGFQELLARFIASTRTPKVQDLYRQIGGGSPIRFETEAQATALAKYLNRNSPDSTWRTYIAMRYSKPFLKDTLPLMMQDDIKKLFVIPLYPQYSSATSGSSLIECKELFAATAFSKDIDITYVESWHDNFHYIQLIVNRIQTRLEELARQNITETRHICILFSAHGLPVKYIAKGDPYQEQLLTTVRLVMSRFPLHKHLVSYQSRVGPVQWLQPSTEKAIENIIKQQRIKNIIVVPVSFVGDHIETLQEIAIQYRDLAKELGAENFLLTRTPKANPLLIKALASLIEDPLAAKAGSLMLESVGSCESGYL